jgi:hypothetical protein
MRLINRDESRHIAIDYHMVEHYASDAYAAERGRRTLAETLRRVRQLVQLLYLGAPFFRQIFFEPMRLTDPEGVRTREAFKRMQLLGIREDVLRRLFARFLYRVLNSQKRTCVVNMCHLLRELRHELKRIWGGGEADKKNKRPNLYQPVLICPPGH